MSDASPAPSTARGASLTLRGIHKRFGAVVALDGASIEVVPGTVHALLGENGAGKSTLMRIAFGLTQADAGDLVVHGAARRFRHSAEAIGAGIGMVHQHFSLVPAMTAAENVALGGRGRFHPARAAARLREVARSAGLAVDPEARVEELPVAAQQRLEILKALVRGARLLMLDEPTAVLAPREIDELMAWLRRYVAQGNAAVLITHKLREALAVADDVTVLRQGRTVLARPAAETDAALLAAAMVGKGGEDAGGPAHARGAPPETQYEIAKEGGHHPTTATRRENAPSVVDARDLAIRDARGAAVVRDASFALAAGEIVGLAAVEGSGQHELLRVLAGRMRPAHGALRLPAPAAIAFVPEDRHRDALALDFSLAESVALRGSGARRGRLRWAEVVRRTAALLREHDVRAAGPTVPVRTLSGGNQQKLVLARELADEPALVVAENPTRGLDVHATVQVHAQLTDAAARGAAVLLYSTDLDEVLTLATRVLVLHGGRIDELPPDRERVGRAMLGAT
ncbi:MAG TPA: ABC transporter ATP-binding protein [Gemmatimonadaceae bacterium]|nr:ABC transporter ATP-binding protein [Gemmatimonadaceae bacterium]